MFSNVNMDDSKNLSIRSSLEKMQFLEFHVASKVPQGGRGIHVKVP